MQMCKKKLFLASLSTHTHTQTRTYRSLSLSPFLYLSVSLSLSLCNLQPSTITKLSLLPSLVPFSFFFFLFSSSSFFSFIFFLLIKFPTFCDTLVLLNFTSFTFYGLHRFREIFFSSPS